jgi:hypothetical protein
VGIPARALRRTEVQALWGEFLTHFVDYDNRSSSGKARRELGWHPQAAYGLLDDIGRVRIASLRRGCASAKRLELPGRSLEILATFRRKNGTAWQSRCGEEECGLDAG